jgi:hypothetical protein
VSANGRVLFASANMHMVPKMEKSREPFLLRYMVGHDHGPSRIDVFESMVKSTRQDRRNNIVQIVIPFRGCIYRYFQKGKFCLVRE